MTYTAAIESKRGSGKFDSFLYENKVNSCRFGTGNYNFILKFVLMATRKYSNINLTCPMPKKNYYLRNVIINDSFFPPIFPDNPILLKVVASCVVVGKSKIQELYWLQAEAQVIKSLT